MKRPAKYTYEYPHPAVTADAVVWTFGDNGWRILLIQRKSPPFVGKWALPGGFVNKDEPPSKACLRELREVTGVVVRSVRDVGVFGDKDRDPRGWTISAAYYALLPEGEVTAKAGDDAAHVAWHSMNKLPRLAFDHLKIIDAAVAKIRDDLYCTPIAAPTLERSFLLKDALTVFRALDSNPLEEMVERLESNGFVRRTKDGRLRFVAARAARKSE